MLLCWNCGHDISEEPLPLSRQASCQQCGEFLHCCELCTQFEIGRPDDCSNQLADPPSNKSTANFCEYFEPRENYSKANSDSAASTRARLDALFSQEATSESIDTSSDRSDLRTPTTPSTNPSKNPLDDLFND